MDERITVKVAGYGTMKGAELQRDAATRASCSLCGGEAEAVADLGSGGAYACAACLRARLDALSVGRFRLREGHSERPGSPWGKVSG